MPKLPQQPDAPRDKSLQINVNSEDDAKAVIQHLQQIKRTWDMLADTAGVTSIEFCIAETMRRKVDETLMGAIRWCRTYCKSVKPFEGNVHFPLPHYIPPAVQVTKTEASNKPVPPVAATDQQQAAMNQRAFDQLDAAEALPPQTQTPGKSKRPVRAETAGT